MSLLNQLQYSFPIINVFSGSEADNPYYSLCIPKLFIQTHVTRKGLKQFINRQRLALGHDTPMKNGLLILAQGEGRGLRILAPMTASSHHRHSTTT